jgi:hypothetical protein
MSSKLLAKDKPEKCPACGSAHVIPIVYGNPSPEDIEEDMAGRIALGGCCITSDDPAWTCRDCHAEIYRYRKADGKDLT